MTWKDALEEFPSLLGEVDFDETPIVSLTFPADKPAFLQVIDYHGHVSWAHEVLLGKISLGKRPQKVESVENPELSGGDPPLLEMAVNAHRSGVSRASELDVAVQGLDLLLSARVVCGHNDLQRELV